MEENKIKELLSQFGRLFGGRRKGSSKNLQSLLELASREPTNGYPHLKIGEIYQKLGEKQNALKEYLRAAEIFCASEQYHKGVAIYIRILKDHPESEFVKEKLADTYWKMGFLGQAFTQYHGLFYSYKKAGLEDRALGILGFMAELDPQKSTLVSVNIESQGADKTIKGRDTNDKNPDINLKCAREEETFPFFDLAETLERTVELDNYKSVIMKERYRFEDIIKEVKETSSVEKLYLNYNYEMGLVCKEMGLIDEAIKQFQMALKKEQRPIEATKLLGQCLKGKGRLGDRKSSEMLSQEEDAIN